MTIMIKKPNTQETFELLQKLFGNDWTIDDEDMETVSIAFNDPDEAARAEKVIPE